jgi:hypothetical protein
MCGLAGGSSAFYRPRMIVFLKLLLAVGTGILLFAML